MKLALCLFQYYPFGGLEYNFIRIVAVCQARGYDVDIYTRNWQGEVPENLNVVIIPARGWTNHRRCQSFVEQLQKILPQKKYDAVLGFNRMPGLDFYYAADVCYEDDIRERHNWFYRLLPRYKIYAAFEQAVFSPQTRTKILTIVSNQKTIYQQYYKTPDSRFYLLPAGINKKFILTEHAVNLRQRMRKRFGVDDTKKIMLLIGSDFERKGVDRAICALAALPIDVRRNTVLWIVGKGKTGIYQKLAKKLRVLPQTIFLGTSDDVPALLVASDLLIHPARREAAGNVLLEAIITGIPVLTTDTCGFAFHVERAQAGKVIPSPYEQTALNQALLEMLTSPLYDQWKARALQYAETEDLYSRAEKAVDIIEKIVNR